MFLVNGQVTDQLPVTDRGLHYGDGLFETMAVVNGTVRFWQQHFQRLQKGCQYLSIPVPEQKTLDAEIERILSSHDREEQAVIKLIVTRGSGGRGYKPPVSATPSRILGLYPWPDYPEDFSTQGIKLYACKTRLSQNTSLAGLKHLNRLEQVLARNEWLDDSFAEGLMCDQQGRVIEGTMTNLFWIHDDCLCTPRLDFCGVEGIMRARILQLASDMKLKVKINNYGLDNLLSADGVFLCNSIIGIWPVAQFKQINWKPHPIARQFMELLR